MPAPRCALGFVAKTGKAVAAAVGPGPELLGRWELLLVPARQERFVYHAAQDLGAGAKKWVATATRVIARQTQEAVDALLADIDCKLTRAAIVGKSLDLSAPLDAILASHTLLHTAEGALYRSVIVDALHERGIECMLIAPADLADPSALDPFGKVPSPWRKEHKDAALAALAVLSPDRADGRGRAPRTGAGARRRPRA
jgi:hypothetical protein